MSKAERIAGLSRRPEQPGDAAFLRQLFHETRGGILAFVEPALAEQLLRQQFAGQTMTYRAAFPDARFDIVDCEATPIGRIVVDQTAHAVRVVDIALRVAWRRRGIGTQLLREVFDQADTAGLPVDLCVGTDNCAARRLYARLGFVVTAVGATEIDMRRAAKTLIGPSAGA